MYQTQFGLSRRPFSATPDATCVVPVGGMPEALSELERCVMDGQGIGILTAPAGLGKTVLCRKLAESLREQFAVVYLPNANFPTRRSLLQAILYEMGHPYLRFGEQELRLEFTTAVRDLYPDHQGLAIIVDEAHLLHNRLIEELRTATNLVFNGEMLVRLILCGQLELEERLVRKEMAAINQRIVCHCSLSSLSILESEEYLQHRIEWAGGRLSEIFDSEAVRMICQASDGNPRCLNQLADHSLLLASTGNDNRASTAHVLDALNELQQLPLQWNRVESLKPANNTPSQVVEIVCDSCDELEDEDAEPQTACYEWGASESEATSSIAEEPIDVEVADMIAATSEAEPEIEVPWDEEEVIVAEQAPQACVANGSQEVVIESEVESTASSSKDVWAIAETPAMEEERVADYYAQLDNGQTPLPIYRELRDWENWDPVQELRDEEDGFAIPLPPTFLPEYTIINALPVAGEEWQPEDISQATRGRLAGDPSELIDQVLPLIDAALCDDICTLDLLQGQTETDSAPTISDPLLLDGISADKGFSPEDFETFPILLNELPPWMPGNGIGESSEYLLMTPAADPKANLEEQLAQMVLDTYADLQPLLWNSTDQSVEPTVEPPPRIAGEEPIRDPGDATPFEELRQTLQEAVDAVQPIAEPKVDPPKPAASRSVQYDIVLPELDEEAASPQTIEIDNTSAPRPYRNLFSKIRQKKQA